MKELFEGMLPIALQCGIGIFDFWDMTYGEITMTIKAFNDKEINRLKEKAIMDYQLANIIGLSVARLMDKNAKYPEIEKVYPSLFDVPKDKPVQVDWRIAKERLMKYTDAHNRKRGSVTQ